MTKTARLGLASVSLFLLLFPLTLGKPGLPTRLKADEAAYYGAGIDLFMAGVSALQARQATPAR